MLQCWEADTVGLFLILNCHERKSRDVTTKALVALLCIPVIHDNVTVSQHTQYSDVKLKQPKLQTLLYETGV